jgi:hypothetical protein
VTHSPKEDDHDEIFYYDLRRANLIDVCEDIPPERDHLLSMMKNHRFGSEFKPGQARYEIHHHLKMPHVSFRKLFSGIKFRLDRGMGISVALLGFDSGIGYIVPKVNWIVEKDVSIEAMLTSSASRFFDWYASAGAGYEADREINQKGNLVALDTRQWNLVTEVGVKFRFRLPGKARILAFGHHFAGARVGLRASGFSNLEYQRIAFEFGPGVW